MGIPPGGRGRKPPGGYRGGHAHVRIDQPVYLGLKAYLVGLATRRTEDEMAAEVRRVLAFEPYAPVRAQCLGSSGR